MVLHRRHRLKSRMLRDSLWEAVVRVSNSICGLHVDVNFKVSVSRTGGDCTAESLARKLTTY